MSAGSILKMQPTYENALALLESRQRKARPTKLAQTPGLDLPATPSGAPTVKGTPSIVGMKEWLLKLGHSENDVDNLNVIHVTGTKGKGSTCAFTRSFLHAHGLRTGFPKRIGLYTSPDLQCIRERIQIDNQPITETVFTQHFFEVWEALASSPEGKSGEITRQPRYLQLLLLLAFHTFIKEGVDAAIVETHHGGEYCATNVVRQPVVTGITSLGLDHVAQLGPTVEDIAWHKSGIFKPGAPAFSVDQEPGPAEVLRGRAAERKTVLTFVSPSNTLPANSRVLGVPVQRLNCSLAIQLASKFVEIKDSSHPLSERDIIEGVQNFSWLGRFEIIETKSARWLLDGAHNTLSITQAAAWFATNVKNGDGGK
ncbi:Folylpolyglutamate synthase [Penicillium oxalicum]|uniref:Folylpolyglutamate synthase n=1 Tax=Penicillium oxalicum TaxID=69781 RepID=UPI0020B8654D|nr:Folylpolyglutamate synthase [Penicillium oxalicum]KAI2788080.1 Folylpolyglutamate synthase [Penicillium oxalicum]